jgi:hypothetical protein
MSPHKIYYVAALFALLELIRIAGRRKVTQIQIKLFEPDLVNCFSLQSHSPSSPPHQILIEADQSLSVS